MNNENPFGELIYSYSRSQAIADGVRIDLSQVDSIRQHWKHPFACTDGVSKLIQEALRRDGPDVSGICHDISTMAKFALRTAQPGTDRILFEVIIGERTHTLKLHISPGDTPEPVITLVLRHEN